MPRDAPVSKVAGGRAPSARACSSAATPSMRRSSSRAGAPATRPGAALVHPFDDLDVIAGQGTLGLELVEDVPDLARVIVPVGGGGLAGGIGIALRRRSASEVELIGVQARAVRAR